MNSEPLPVVLVLVGYARRLDLTVPAILRELSEARASLKIVACVSVLSSPNPRGLSTIKKSIEEFANAQNATSDVQVYEEAKVEKASKAVLDAVRTAGDPWPLTLGRSLSNHVHFLKLSELAYEQLKTTGLSNPVLFIRADMLPSHAVFQQDDWDIGDSEVRTPRWHSWGGLNDRIALLGKNTVEPYMCRIKSAEDFASLGIPLHAETFLLFSVLRFDWRRHIDVKFVRVRANSIVEEDWSAVRGLGARAARFSFICMRVLTRGRALCGDLSDYRFLVRLAFAQLEK